MILLHLLTKIINENIIRMNTVKEAVQTLKMSIREGKREMEKTFNESIEMHATSN